MIKLKNYKVFLYGIILLGVVLFIFGSCALKKLIKVINYNEGQIVNLPDTFRVELPLLIDPTGYFCVDAHINKEYDERFILDTQCLTNLYKMDNLKEKATYWGEYPLIKGNSAGERVKNPLYYFNNFEITHLSFGKPFFWGIDSTEYTYQIMSRNVIGENTLSMLNWKFDLDNKKLILFGNKDSSLMLKETDGYIKISGGLGIKKIPISFPQIGYKENFTLDLGSTLDVNIDKRIFKILSKTHPYRKIKTSIGYIYLFNNIKVQLGNMIIDKCQVIHKPFLSNNYIGVPIMHHFNFILYYRDTHLDTPKDLYYQPNQNFNNYKSASLISDFGFNVSEKDGIISAIEVDGIADKAGLMLKDKVISIDDGAFNLENKVFLVERFIDYQSDKQNVNVRIERDGKTIDYQLNK